MSKWKVYISSTFKDLKEFRATLIHLFQKQLKASFELTEIMERMYDKGTYTPFVEDCIKAVKSCDVYIIILGNKIGSYPPDEERTYTEIELETALSHNKKVFCLRLENFDESKIDDKLKHDEILGKFEGRPIHTFNDMIGLENTIYNCLIPLVTQSSDTYKTKIKEYVDQDGFRTFLLSLTNDQNIRNYSNQPPFFFGDIIRVMDVDDNNKVYQKYRNIGDERFWLIQAFFNSYLNLCKKCILSILWDEIRTNNIETPKSAIYEVLVDSTVNQTKLETLSMLCDEIISHFGERKEKAFIQNVMLSFDLFSQGISVFGNLQPDAKAHWEAELLLHDLMKQSKFLNQYQVRSIRARYYVRHRNDEREQYTLEYSNKRNELLVVEEEQVNEKFVNIHSLYLCQKGIGGDIVINLSPFYFDKNSHDQNAAKIKLFAFDRIILDDDDIYLNYLPIYNPRERSNEVSNSNIAIGKDKVVSDQLMDIESMDKKRKLERQLSVHKINKLYEQFIPFLNVISNAHA